jgi:hypothetical protein
MFGKAHAVAPAFYGCLGLLTAKSKNKAKQIRSVHGLVGLDALRVGECAVPCLVGVSPVIGENIMMGRIEAEGGEETAPRAPVSATSVEGLQSQIKQLFAAVSMGVDRSVAGDSQWETMDFGSCMGGVPLLSEQELDTLRTDPADNTSDIDPAKHLDEAIQNRYEEWRQTSLDWIEYIDLEYYKSMTHMRLEPECLSVEYKTQKVASGVKQIWEVTVPLAPERYEVCMFNCIYNNAYYDGPLAEHVAARRLGGFSWTAVDDNQSEALLDRDDQIAAQLYREQAAGRPFFLTDVGTNQRHNELLDIVVDMGHHLLSVEGADQRMLSVCYFGPEKKDRVRIRTVASMPRVTLNGSDEIRKLYVEDNFMLGDLIRVHSTCHTTGIYSKKEILLGDTRSRIKKRLARGGSSTAQ